jgi:hypothetical protein
MIQAQTLKFSADYVGALQGYRQSRNGVSRPAATRRGAVFREDILGNRGVGLGWKCLILEEQAKAVRARHMAR